MPQRVKRLPRGESFYAHSDPNGLPPDAPAARWEPLCRHLREVAATARTLARRASPGDEAFADAAYWAGLLHDVGKYSEAFQRRILGESGARAEHSGHGAALAAQHGALEIAFAVAGHHAGLPDRDGDH